MIAISTAEVYDRMYAHVDAHNNAQSEVRHTIRLGKLKTLDSLVNQYVKLLRRHLRRAMAADSDELPPIYTNRNDLAALAKCGRRTIYDHLEGLKAAGLVYKVFRGRQHDFTVWINPWLFLPDNFPAPPTVDLATASHPGFTPFMRQLSPVENTLEGSSNSPNSGVNSVEKPLGEMLAGFPPNSRVSREVRQRLERETAPHQQETDPKGSLDKGPGGGGPRVDAPIEPGRTPQDSAQNAPEGQHDTGDTQVGGSAGRVGNARPTVNCPHTPPAGTTVLDPANLDQTSRSGASANHERDIYTRQQQIKLTKGFWEAARERFWPDQYFSEDHRRKILNLIWTDVLYGSYRCSTDQSSHQLYARRIKQLEIAGRYAKKQNWVSMLPPLAYFSRAHYKKQLETGQKGNFHFTTAWLEANEKQTAVVQMERLIDRAINSVLNLRPPHKWRGEVTTISLYTYWSNRLKSNVSDVLRRDRFDTAVLAVTGQINAHISPQ